MIERKIDLEGCALTYIELLCIAVLCNGAPSSFRGVHEHKPMEINKDLIAASSTPIVLAILAEGDSYGYAILARVRELSGGHLEWTDGMLYPVLHRLERLGYVQARWEVADTGRRRKYYQITPAGRDHLVAERRQWQTVDATLRGVWSALRLPEAGHPMTLVGLANGA